MSLGNKDEAILLYGLICLAVGGVLGILAVIINTSLHYQFFPTGILLLSSGSLLITGLVSPVIYAIVKLIEKVRRKQ